MSTYFVHAIGWGTNENLVFAGGAEHPDDDVDALIASDSEADVLYSQRFRAFDLTEVTELLS
jgi:hypothetical protein